MAQLNSLFFVLVLSLFGAVYSHPHRHPVYPTHVVHDDVYVIRSPNVEPVLVTQPERYINTYTRKNDKNSIIGKNNNNQESNLDQNIRLNTDYPRWLPKDIKSKYSNPGSLTPSYNKIHENSNMNVNENKNYLYNSVYDEPMFTNKHNIFRKSSKNKTLNESKNTTTEKPKKSQELKADINEKQESKLIEEKCMTDALNFGQKLYGEANAINRFDVKDLYLKCIEYITFKRCMRDENFNYRKFTTLLYMQGAYSFIKLSRCTPKTKKSPEENNLLDFFKMLTRFFAVHDELLFQLKKGKRSKKVDTIKGQLHNS